MEKKSLMSFLFVALVSSAQAYTIKPQGDKMYKVTCANGTIAGWASTYTEAVDLGNASTASGGCGGAFRIQDRNGALILEKKI